MTQPPSTGSAFDSGRAERGKQETTQEMIARARENFY